MSKNIVFCADGTWNGPPDQNDKNAVDRSDNGQEGADPTNVYKLFQNLAGAITPETQNLPREQEKALREGGNLTQVAKYLHGVGDSGFKLEQLFGGAFGVGMIARIVRGYTFISRWYEDGDEITIVGFSRGAYTARALAGMIASVGLLNPKTYDVNDKELAYGLGISAWKRYREVALQKANWFSRVANFLVDTVQGTTAKPLPADGLIANVPIKAVGVWDTVGSLGVPLYGAQGSHVDVFRFADSALSNKVEHGFHAMAINEEREDFPVSKWDARENVEQIWMLGAHADVGGGYPAAESVLSNIGLTWMMTKLSDVGVRFVDQLPYPFDPQDLTACVSFKLHTPWLDVPFNVRGRIQRQVAQTDLFHPTVVKRLQTGAGYVLPGLQLAAADISKLQTDTA
jgi:glutathione S-transferase